MFLTYDTMLTAMRRNQPQQPKARKSPPMGKFTKNDAGRFDWEHNDCAVRALALAKGMPYAEAHKALKAAGRRDRRGTYVTTMEALLGNVERTHWRTEWMPTAARFLDEHRKGVYVVWVTGHFFALVNGIQLDMGESLYKPRARVRGYWKVA